ncbi:hypothetical protein DPMN_174331 [Dreissena polymorpha]|uniref:Uncharacterized protein n=1 Tax=Dreissena polymorpha TaxID=45954 RepID=A0A9D4IIH2_DREPO|nr:hypothetical protein DPMN_174331 [Dreissena polymorpha]
MQITGLADGSSKVGPFSNVEAEFYYWTFINQVYELMLDTLDYYFGPCASLSATRSAVTVMEQLVH